MINRVPLIWLVLILLTIGSYTLADASTLPWIAAIILGLAAIKGYLIIDGFMELYGYKGYMRYAMNLYCPILSLFIWLLVKH
ncbi:MAG: cytochrome C oxidase subunit IV family protein [Pseudomonadales bacterium]|nr:cytochrome C oxidase subunit IV family protein [Pseudomonadales bacterium]MCP5214017.1 cytochrome C oxidase subunit IV family protein [Pseudomonadales bacterium]MCP5302776.1 cytochrome C oxidase subunit IV family protein [Pseudomonadales bacterium]